MFSIEVFFLTTYYFYQENHLKKNYRDNFVQNFEKLRVQPMTETQKQQLKLDQKQRRKTMRERKRVSAT